MVKQSLKDKMTSKISEVTATSVELGSFREELKRENPIEEANEGKMPEYTGVDNKGKKGRKPSNKELMTKRVNFVMKPTEYALLEQACEKTGRNISNYVAAAVKKAIEQDLAE